MLLANNLSFERSGKCLFQKLDLSVPPQKIIQIRGRNGIGKTTLIKILSNIMLPTTGEIYWNGKNIRKNTNDFFKNLVLILDNNTSKNDGGKLTTANISTNFMGTSQLNVNWQFDINNLNDTFNIKGEAKQVSADAMNMFFVPAVNVKAIGTLNELYFNYSGDKNDALGDMRIDYSTFKVEVLRKDGSSKNRLLSGIVNLFLDNNEKDGRVTKQDVSVTRDKTKSFWNYFWLCIRNGALQSLTKS